MATSPQNLLMLSICIIVLGIFMAPPVTGAEIPSNLNPLKAVMLSNSTAAGLRCGGLLDSILNLLGLNCGYCSDIIIYISLLIHRIQTLGYSSCNSITCVNDAIINCPPDLLGGLLDGLTVDLNIDVTAVIHLKEQIQQSKAANQCSIGQIGNFCNQYGPCLNQCIVQANIAGVVSIDQCNNVELYEEINLKVCPCVCGGLLSGLLGGL